MYTKTMSDRMAKKTVEFSILLYIKFRLSNHRDYFILYLVSMSFKAESPSYAGNMNAAGKRTIEYGFERRIWGGISFVVTKRGNHALVLQKGGNLHCLF